MGLVKVKNFSQKSYPRAFPIPHTPIVCWKRGRWPITNRSFQQARLLGFCVWSMQFLKRRPGTSSLRWKSGFMGWLRSRGMLVTTILSGKLNVDGNGRCKGRGGAFSLAVFLLKHVFGEGQNALPTSPTLLRNEWRIFCWLGWVGLRSRCRHLRCLRSARAGHKPRLAVRSREILRWLLPRSE